MAIDGEVGWPSMGRLDYHAALLDIKILSLLFNRTQRQCNKYAGLRKIMTSLKKTMLAFGHKTST